MYPKHILIPSFWRIKLFITHNTYLNNKITLIKCLFKTKKVNITLFRTLRYSSAKGSFNLIENVENKRENIILQTINKQLSQKIYQCNSPSSVKATTIRRRLIVWENILIIKKLKNILLCCLMLCEVCSKRLKNEIIHRTFFNANE